MPSTMLSDILSFLINHHVNSTLGKDADRIRRLRKEQTLAKMNLSSDQYSRIVFDGIDTGVDRGLSVPPLQGPYKQIGFIDVEWEVKEERETVEEKSRDSSSTTSMTRMQRIKKEGDEHPFPFNKSVYARIYYPSEPLNQAEYQSRLARWIPSSPYLSSYGYFVKLPLWITRPFTRWCVGNQLIPAVEGLNPISGPDGKHFPLIIFSHGMGATRTTYTGYCTQLASHGYVVAVVEHREGSAAMTLVNRHQTLFPYEQPKSMTDTQAEGTLHRDYDTRKCSDSVLAKAIGEHGWRHRQLLYRAAEIQTLADILLQHNPDIKWKSWSPSGNIHGEILKQLTVDKSASVTVAGHSYGGASAIYSAGTDSRFAHCIALDPWMFPLPIGPTSDWLTHHSFSLQIQNSATFQWADNLLSQQELLITLAPNPRFMITLVGSTHQEFGDFPCIIDPEIIKAVRGTGGTIDPELAIFISAALSLRFIRPCLSTLAKLTDESLEKARHNPTESDDSTATCFGMCSTSSSKLDDIATKRAERSKGMWTKAIMTADQVFSICGGTLQPTYKPIVEHFVRIEYMDNLQSKMNK